MLVFDDLLRQAAGMSEGTMVAMTRHEWVDIAWQCRRTALPTNNYIAVWPEVEPD
jgi:hypothetical protein